MMVANFNIARFGQRLNSAIAASGRTHHDIARLIGVDKSCLARAIRGRNGLRGSTIAALCSELSISADWLLGIEGLARPLLPDRPPEDGWLP